MKTKTYKAINTKTGNVIATCTDPAGLRYYIGRYMLCNGFTCLELKIGRKRFEALMAPADKPFCISLDLVPLR